MPSPLTRCAMLGVVGALAGSLAGCLSKPPPLAPSTRIVHYSSRRLELTGGLRVVLERAPDFGTAAAVLLVGTGSGDEPPSKAGLAHLTEHVVAEARHDGWSPMDRFHRLGVRANAMTSWDETTYFAVDDAGALDALVSALDGILREPTAGVDQALLERERRAVLNELHLRTENGTPGQAVGWLMAATFPAGHPYAHTVAGTPEAVSSITLDDVRAFAAAQYRPERSTLVVSAPFSLDETQALVERSMARRGQVPGSAWTSRGRVDTQGVRSMPASFNTRAADVPVPVLWIGWSVPAGTGPTSAVAPVLEAALHSGLSGMIARDPDIVSVGLSLYRGSAASLLGLAVTLKEGVHPERSARLVADTMAADVPGFESMKRLVAGRNVYAEEDLLSRALRLAWSAHQTGDPTFLRTLAERIAQQSREDVRQYSDTFLRPEQAQVVLVRPATGTPAASPGPAASRDPVVQTVASLPAATPPAAAESRSRALSTISDTRRFVANLQTRTLSNGLTLIMLPRPGSPFHTALLGFRGGTALATPPGVLVAARWGRWHETASPEEWGLLYGYELTADTTREVLQSTGSDVSLTLKLLGEQVNHETSWPPRRFLDLLGVFEREERAPATLFARAFDRAFFGNHPLASWPTANDIQHIAAADVLAWIHRVRRPRNAALVIVGDFDPNEAARSAEEHFADWGESPENLPEFSLPTSMEPQAARGDDERLVVQNRPDTSTASVRLRCWLPPVKPDKLAPYGIFKEGIERELRSRLREELGASYSVSGQLTSLLGGSVYYEIVADADYARLAAALRIARELFRRPRAVFEDGARFEQLRSIAVRIKEQDTRTDAHQLFHDWSMGWPLDTGDRYVDQVRRVHADEVGPVADRCAATWIVGALGDEAKVRAAWRAAALPAPSGQLPAP